jgi:heme/copper-type cytochrome/quinol oxidase subunit 2
MNISASKPSHFLPWLVILISAFLIIIFPFPVHAQGSTEQIFKVQASRFNYTPSILRVNPGDRVTIELTSQDVVHGLAVDGYGLEVQADPGQTARLTFTADQAGTFRLRCSVTCGPMHPFMIGKLQVGNNQLLWRSAGLAVLVTLAGLWKSHR